MEAEGLEEASFNAGAAVAAGGGAPPLQPHTALGLRLWRADAELGDPRARAARAALMDHGGEGPGQRLERAAVAAACALVLRGDDAVEALFAWLGRSRIHAVAVARGLGCPPAALAVYATMAANHSCVPNAVLRFGAGSRLEIVASLEEGLAPGAEATRTPHGPLAQIFFLIAMPSPSPAKTVARQWRAVAGVRSPAPVGALRPRQCA